ncbi:MAG: hypothetical protein KBF75_08990 [Saprospiraceae bacterium]|jgi:hypothetical protein|nr:hypothetical protein [Saprospiraceae bacterium]MCB0603266.1 hypothetical protein [Saprospiraceae bacterium]
MNNTKSNVSFYILFAFSFLMVFLSGVSLIGNANQDQLSGKVLFNDKTPVQDVVINLLEKDDLSLVASEMPDTWGEYSFNKIQPGDYYISVQQLDQTQKVYGPIHISKIDDRIEVKPITVYLTKSTQAVISDSQFNSAS